MIEKLYTSFMNEKTISFSKANYINLIKSILYMK